jgi:uroporphyrinogen decarboxylase
VGQAIHLTKQALNGRIPLIGFAGAPFTLLCYMVEGKGSKTFDKAKAFCYTQPEAATDLLDRITTVTIDYLHRQVAAGADVVQVFDSWSGLLHPEDFDRFALPYLKRIADALSPSVPVILFPKGSWYALEALSKTRASGIGLDWCVPPAFAREKTGGQITLQGNYDPSKLLQPIPIIQKEVKAMIDAFGPQRYIANLGHGIMPHVPVDHARAFVDAVKSYSTQTVSA